MKYIRRYNESTKIKATDETIEKIVLDEIKKLGNNADLNHIDVSEVTIMGNIFSYSKFNGDISLWNVLNVKVMCYVFYNTPFNGDISRWNVQNVTDMYGMFNSSHFNGHISDWDVRNVTNMSNMFSFSHFNDHISNWSVGNVQNMYGMFRWSQFNRDISNWNVRNVEEMGDMFDNSPLKGREPWWYTLSPIFNGDNYSMFDSLDFKWIDLERKIIYGDKLSRILRKSYNRKWNGKLPPVFGFTYQ